MDSASPELVRAWQLYFKQRGGAGPTLPPDVLPVVILDDNSAGPFCAYRPFQAGATYVAQAGVYSKIGIQNTDDRFTVGSGIVGASGVPRSVVVVDRVIISKDAVAGGDFYATLTHQNLFPMDFDIGPVADVSPQKDPDSQFTRPQLGNVHIGFRQVGAALMGDNSGKLPGFTQDQLPHQADGPWIIGPGGIFYIERDVVNSSFSVYFRGRYYAAP